MKVRRSILSILFLFLSIICAPAVSAQDVSIAAWNIGGAEAIPADRVERIARVIQRIDPHVIVLSEVNPVDVADQIVTELESLGVTYINADVPPQNSTVVQHIAILHKPGVNVSNVRLIPGSDLAEEERSRKAVAADVRIRRFDFVLIGVHLKSGREEPDREQRTRQAEVLASFIDQVTSDDEKDVLVVGDYNMIPRIGNRRNDEDNFLAMNPNNFLRFITSESPILGRRTRFSRCNPLTGNQLDGFAISRVQTRREYRAGSIRVPTFSNLGSNCAAFIRDVSDHLPLIARFRTGLTDDD